MASTATNARGSGEGPAASSPDTTGDVGPNHYIQAVNTSLAIFDKGTGTRLAAFTFNATIFPLIKNKCNGCHATAASGGGILLATYDQIKAMVQSGQLMGSIERLSGYSPMPKWSNKLPDCEIMQVKKWIAAGILNN
mgnify:CR=1 FL=1